ncbi:hypothetical protein GUITHDRAFT_99118 [Guillardia theta CCMP2712]|uniref:Uncharacterized protein n=1 Tax=Guillardia theta (strain CCMP2712) TaxID=905079 RepID=L1K447_GUITC|nr:hypothetical protein GUITHDRAFT_99118 [Guillardia theta CCMP2712]EKX55337.1 hypothetical protein GUITHDRAFT_99118 [Guillardia theta CCMP2712]|eukprot:XP_005842317.1 hypothetical protein GUITHDRAFT_99118 [Guillardia theta CCMP2712]
MQSSDETRKLLDEQTSQSGEAQQEFIAWEKNISTVRMGLIVVTLVLLSVQFLLLQFGESIALLCAAQVGLRVHKPPRTVFLDKDWGPATKVLGALLLEHDPNTVIITLDDDIFYNKRTVEWLATHIDDKDMALSFGCEMWNNQHSNFKSFTTYSFSNIFVTTPRVCNGWLVGWTAVAHRVSNFGEDVWMYLDRLPRGCFYNDDIWMSGYVGRRGIRKVYAPWVVYHAHHRRDKDLSLSTIEGTRERNAFPCAVDFFG